MLEQKFLDRFDMERRIQSRLYCFGSGSADEGGGGDDSPAADDTQANYEQEAFGGSSNPVVDIVTMGRPMSEPPPVLDTPLRRDIAESMFQDFAATLPPAPVTRPVGVVTEQDALRLPAVGQQTLAISPENIGLAGSQFSDSLSPDITSVTVRSSTGAPMSVPINQTPINQTGLTPMQALGFEQGLIEAGIRPTGVVTQQDAQRVNFGMDAPATRTDLGMVTAAPQLSLPEVAVGLSNEAFNTDSGERIGLERIDGPAVPTPPPPRFQTNAQRDFFENLAGQGDAAMNQFRAEVRDLDNRGFLGSQIAAGIGADGVPNFDTSFPAGSQIRGVTTTNFVDLPVIGTIPVSTYTGLDNPNASSDTSSDETVPPVTNPLTGRSQCPDGYVFDEDLQACRRKNKRELQADNGTGGDSSRPAGDMFFRRTSLDDAPANLPSGFDFDAANRAFTQSFAVRPSFFQRPPDLTGFTLL